LTPVTISSDSSAIKTEEMPSLTYKIDFKQNRITEKIDNLEALKQAIYCALNTARYDYIIYSHNYGNELENAIGLDYDLAIAECKRYISEAILADDRFVSVNNFEFSRIDSETMEIQCDVESIYGLTINVKTEANI